jgi:formylglycine-generating enzyme required for sulfatase activity
MMETAYATTHAVRRNPGGSPMNARRIAKLLRLLVCILVAVACLPVTESKPEEPGKAAPPADDLMLGKEAGQVRDDNGVKLMLVWCPPGEFMMGSPDSEADRRVDEDQVKVILTKGLWMGKFEITQSEWIQVMGTEPWKDKKPIAKEGDDFPATFVSWGDAMEFCIKLTARERKAGRLPDRWEYTLPTEAQWERACRAGSKTKFSFGDDGSNLVDYAWFLDGVRNPDEQYSHRGQKKPNSWGLYDMHGNVAEWCRDWYGNTLLGGRDPEITKEDSDRVLRGGGWDDIAGGCRAARRLSLGPSRRCIDAGFRVALSPLKSK